MERLTQDELLSKYAAMWNHSWWDIMRFQKKHPGLDEKEYYQASVFEMETMWQRMIGLIPASHERAIYDLIYGM